MPSLDRPKVDNWTPENLVRAVQRGEVRIPTFQRSYRWPSTLSCMTVVR
jgi:hypothetical protein